MLKSLIIYHNNIKRRLIEDSQAPYRIGLRQAAKARKQKQQKQKQQKQKKQKQQKQRPSRGQP